MRKEKSFDDIFRLLLKAVKSLISGQENLPVWSKEKSSLRGNNMMHINPNFSLFAIMYSNPFGFEIDIIHSKESVFCNDIMAFL